MTTNIQYTSTPEPNGTIDILLVEDVMKSHKTVPESIKLAYAWIKFDVAMWLLGCIDFDRLMDKIGALADKLKEADETQQIISDN